MTDRIDVRSAGSGDRAFVAGLVSSLLEFGSPAWKNAEELAPRFRKVLAEAVRKQDQRSAVLIAEDDDGTPLGFISRNVGEDVSGIERGHVADLAISDKARRRAVGRALMGPAKPGARRRGLPVISLDVWSTHRRALAFYRSLGYQPESLCLIKALDRSAD